MAYTQQLQTLNNLLIFVLCGFPLVHYIPLVYMIIKMELNPANNFRADLLFS